jgi:hypothetical protein
MSRMPPRQIKEDIMVELASRPAVLLVSFARFPVPYASRKGPFVEKKIFPKGAVFT